MAGFGGPPRLCPRCGEMQGYATTRPFHLRSSDPDSRLIEDAFPIWSFCRLFLFFHFLFKSAGRFSMVLPGAAPKPTPDPWASRFLASENSACIASRWQTTRKLTEKSLLQRERVSA